MQRSYTYVDMGTGTHGPLTQAINNTFKGQNAWPVIFHNKSSEEVEFVLLEVNSDNSTNEHLADNFKNFLSQSKVPVFYANFVSKQVQELTNLIQFDDQVPNFICQMIENSSSSHSYLNHNNTNYFTVDFDYLVFNEGLQMCYAVEVTTLFKSMFSEEEAQRLASFIAEDRRKQHGGSIVRQIQTLHTDTKIFPNCSLVFSIFNSEGRSSKVNLSSQSFFSVVDGNFLTHLSRNQFDFTTFSYSDVTGFIDSLTR